MTKKRINIVLIAVVLLLWGLIGYKTINQYFCSNTIMPNEPKNFSNKNLSQIDKDTFNLIAVSRDPFLNTIKEVVIQKPIVQKSYPVQKIEKPIVYKEPMVWPQISYYGYIKSKEKTKELILVKIAKQLYKLRKDDLVEGVIIKKVFNDSIEVVFNKEKKVIQVN
jgi:hypothetical protein